MLPIRLLVASIALLAVPVASAAPTPTDLAAPEPVEVYGCFNGGVTVVVLGTVAAECVGATPHQPVSVEQCGEVAYQVRVGDLAQTTCIVIQESHACPGGGGYVVVLGVQLGECRPCCDPTLPAAAAADPPVEFTQCDTWGTGVAVYGKEVVCLTTGCSPTCATVAAGPDPFPLVRIEQCPDPSAGNRVTVAGVVVRECPQLNPVAVDLRCNDPAYGVQVYLGGKAATTCTPLPHGV